MNDLADFLAGAVDRRVLDRTGLEGLYRVTLNFSQSPRGALDSEPRRAPAPTSAPALEEQMGLRLESTKASIEMVIIDHIEKPSAN
jgi:uncharacterized protein (TIGR03435 family)